MKRFFGVIVIALIVSGCATMPWSRKIDSMDGINRREAGVIAQDFLAHTEFSDDADLPKGKALVSPEVGCLTNHWLVIFPDKNPFWKLRFYYVVVENATGDLVRFGVNWYQGDYWSPMLRGFDQCR